MLSEKEKQLKNLQEEKEKLLSRLFSIANTEFNPAERETLANYYQRALEIQKEMADLNKLEEKEKNIHAIWIGLLPKGEFDFLKVWTKYNPEYKIHLWTDFTHILTHKLNSIISENSKKINNGVQEHDYLLEAKLKDEFYNKYQLKNFGKTFDENVQQFLLDKGYAKEDEITAWIKDGKEKIIQEQEDIKKYTLSEVILHDVSKEKDGIFPNKEYDEGYLKTLEHLHLCAGASDRLRYAILNKFGGVYLDTDVMPKFNLEQIKNNQEINDLINKVEWKNIYNYIMPEDKISLIINQMIVFDNLNQLDEETLKDFAENWSRVLEGDCEKNFEILKEIAEKFKSMNLSFDSEMKLSEFPITNFLQTGCCISENNLVPNAFIISKENSKFLQELMKKIEVTDEKIKDLETYTKLINKNQMIINHTGPGNFSRTIKENDDTYFFYLKDISSKIVTFENVNSCDTSWYSSVKHKDAIEDPSALELLFWSSKAEVTNYELRKQLENASLTEKEEDFQKPTTSSDFQFEKDELSF